MSFRGMDIERVDRLATELKIQSDAIAAVIGMVDTAISGLAGVWAGDDLHVFTALWQQTHRPRAQSLSAELDGWATALHRQVIEQSAASQVSSGASIGNVALSAATMLTFAKAAENVKTTLPKGWSQVDGRALENLGIEPASLHDRGTGLDASIFTDGHGHYVISYAGTAGSLTGRDWVQNGAGIASPVFANASGQTESAVDLARQLVSRAGVGNVELTGHSLGGRDAAVASVASSALAVTFNAAAVTDEDLLYAKEVSGHHVGLGEYLLDKVTAGDILRDSADQSKITNYAISNDIVTDGQAAAHLELGERTALGSTVVVPTDTADPFRAHLLDNFDGKV